MNNPLLTTCICCCHVSCTTGSGSDAKCPLNWKGQGELCREKEGPCDIPEYCECGNTCTLLHVSGTTASHNLQAVCHRVLSFIALQISNLNQTTALHTLDGQKQCWSHLQTAGSSLNSMNMLVAGPKEDYKCPKNDFKAKGTVCKEVGYYAAPCAADAVCKFCSLSVPESLPCRLLVLGSL
jgi:hypothetical protein